MSNKINPDEIAKETGLTEKEVNLVLSHLIPSWIFARFIDNELSEVDYYQMRKESADN